MKNEDFYDIIDSELNLLAEDFKTNTFLKKQNSTGKKSYLFLLWFLQKYLPNEDLSDLEQYITEGNDDTSCDLIFKNKDQSGNDVYYVVQAKWFTRDNIKGTNKISKEIKACLTDFRIILAGKKESKQNPNFAEQYKKLIAHKKANGKIKFIFLALCNGDIEIKPYIDTFINNLVLFELIDFFKLKQQYIELQYKGIKTHNPIETPYIPIAEFNLEFKSEEFINIQKPHQANIFLIKPIEIYKMFDKYGHSLFYKNIRNPLLKSYFNEEIRNTILNNPINFWYFNNGITAITDKIDDFHEDATMVKLKGIQIINGAQTVYSIYETYKYASEEQKANMDQNGLITFRIVKSGGSDFDLQVTRYTNSQNPISERDFHSNDEVQKRLQNDFLKNSDVWYETRRGEFRTKNRKSILLSNELLGQSYLAFYVNDPFNAKQNKKLIFYSSTIKPDGLYEIIFNNSTKYDDMLVSYLLSQYIDKRRKDFKSKISKIDTTKKVSAENKKLLQFDFIQYANFEILALFKLLLNHSNDINQAAINGKIRFSFEKEKLQELERYYNYISSFILKDLELRKTKDSKIVNSVLFKNKEYYPSLKLSFKREIKKDTQTKKLKLK